MQYIDRPLGREGRSRSEDVGSTTSDILEDGTQFEAQELVEELNQVGMRSVRFTLDDVPAVLSLLAGIEDAVDEGESDADHLSSDSRGSPPLPALLYVSHIKR
eukprot:COSAG05_NODE_60_length_23142_cov_25.372130_18_plen_103_part_00